MKNQASTKEPGRIKSLLDNYRSLAIVTAFLLIGFYSSAQVRLGVRQQNMSKGITFKEIAADSLLRLPKDTLNLLARDSGAIALKNNALYIWTGAKWDTIAGGSGAGEIGAAGFAIIKVGNVYSVDTAALPETNLYVRARAISGNASQAAPFDVPDLELKFASVATLRATTDTLRTGSYIQTNGYYSTGDGGGSRFIVIPDTAGLGLVYDTASLIKIAGGKWARMMHTGTITITQFGGVGNGTANDLLAFRKANDFARAEGGKVKEILGAGPGSTYRLLLRTTVVNQAFLDFNYSNIIWNGNGAKIIFDNDATQSYVKYTDGAGVTGIYRAKESHISSTAPTKTLSFGNQFFELIQDSVSSGVAYPAWATSTQYYGAHPFVILGYPFTAYPTLPTGKAENVIFKNWDLSGGESDARVPNAGYWNVSAKAFLAYENISGFTFDNNKVHNVAAEVFFGAGFVSVDRLSFINSEFYKLTEGLAVTGNLLVDRNIAHDIGAHFVESSPFEFHQTYTNNEVYNVPAAFTIGAYGAAADKLGHVTIDNNVIHDCAFGLNLTFRSRGNNITNNFIIDCGTGINIYGNNGLYEDASSDMGITNNHFIAYRTSPTIGISFGNTNSTANYKTANITVTGNTFEQSKQSKIEGLSTHITNPIQFYGSNFENITVMMNTNYFDETLYPLITNFGSFQPYVAYNYTSINEIDLTEYYTKKWTLNSLSNNFQLVNRSNGTVAIGINYANNNAVMPGKLSLVGFSTMESKFTVASIEIQPYALNNGWLSENIYYDGTAFKHRATGESGMFYFQGKEGQFRFNGTAAAGATVSPGIQAKVNADGVFAAGGQISASVGNYSGATFVASGTGATLNQTGSYGAARTVSGLNLDYVQARDSAILAALRGGALYGGTTITTDYTIPDTVGYVFWNGNSGRTITLSAAPVLNMVKYIHNGGNTNVTLSPGIVTIQGYPSMTNLATGRNIIIKYDGTYWRMVGSNFNPVIPTDYADNAAALAGGLVVGEVYRTGDALKIVH